VIATGTKEGVLSYRADFNLAVHGDRLVLDGVETQNGWRKICQSNVAWQNPGTERKDAYQSGAS
jgi:hypothetical protein